MLTISPVIKSINLFNRLKIWRIFALYTRVYVRFVNFAQKVSFSIPVRHRLRL